VTSLEVPGAPIVSEAKGTTLILGGARSGKSAYAERLLTRHAGPWIYIATAQPLDDEMRRRIAEHQLRRGPDWHTQEAPIALADVLDRQAKWPVLIDCLTLWLTNLMLAGHDVPAAISHLEAVLNSRHRPTVLVSNEVGLGIVPQTPLGRSFRDEAGRLNQRMAALAGHVVFMIAGLPMSLK
jgi:adenosylcobinamide kinase / adenosylcobinamide-phosphate guanylyltransferase